MAPTIEALDTTLQKTNIWLNDLTEQGGFSDQSQAYSALRSVLHALRDRLTVDEAAHLAAQMPMLIRGLFYEGWKPSTVPSKEHTRREFIATVRMNLGGTNIDPEQATQAVFQLLEDNISPGELRDMQQMLPPEIRALWP